MKSGFALFGMVGVMVVLLSVVTMCWQSGALGLRAVQVIDARHHEWQECAAMAWWREQVYELHREELDALRELGETVFNYEK